MTTTSTIGTSSRNYSTIAAWHAAFTTGGWIGECYNDTEFNEVVSIAGSSAANYEILRAATGQSAFDTNTNPLKYDQTRGVAVKNPTNYAITITLGSYITIQGIQFKNDAGGNQQVLYITGSTTNTIVSRCLFFNGMASTVFANKSDGGSTGALITNSVFITYKGTNFYINYATGTSWANCTFVAPSDKANASVGITLANQSPSIKNCAVFGHTGFSFGGTPSGSNNGTDAASIGFGSSNQTSLTYANTFNGTTSSAMDYTLKAGSGLLNVGNTDTTDIPAANDIFGTSRPQGSAWDIGAHEKIVSSSRAYRLTTLGVG